MGFRYRLGKHLKRSRDTEIRDKGCLRIKIGDKLLVMKYCYRRYKQENTLWDAASSPKGKKFLVKEAELNLS